MPVDEFLDALVLIVEECAFFSFENEIYLQTEGLSMGNSLSQVLAEITTSYFLNCSFIETRLFVNDQRMPFALTESKWRLEEKRLCYNCIFEKNKVIL